MNRLVFPLLALATLASVPARAADDDNAPTVKMVLTAPAASRPMLLAPLYLTFSGLQAYDGYATLHGVGNGVHESNALVGGLAGNPAAFWGVKAGSTALTVLVAERLWRNHHRREAIAAMVIANGLMAYVAARNAGTLGATR